VTGRLIYLSDAAIPSRSTNSIQTLRMCAAFASAGVDVTVAYPVRRSETPEGFAGDLHAFYGVPATFYLRRLGGVPQRLIEGGGSVSRSLRAARFGAYLVPAARPGGPPFVAYCRSFLAAAVADLARRAWGPRSACRSVALELHNEPPNRSGWRLLERMDALFPITGALRDVLLQRARLDPGRMNVEHDGVDLDDVNPGRLDRDASRSRLAIEGTGPVIVYTGRGRPGKGVDVILDAAPSLARIGAQVVVVGKIYVDDYLTRAAENVTLTGFVPPSDVTTYLAAADITVLPTTSDLHYAAYTSPLKLFEYMASGRPIVASSLPTIREVLRDGENALLFDPGDAEALADAVRRLWVEPELRERLAAQAWKDVQEFSWKRRAERILGRLESL
jgi:glycosyltransferase involved in cell wall biosynthesis